MNLPAVNHVETIAWDIEAACAGVRRQLAGLRRSIQAGQDEHLVSVRLGAAQDYARAAIVAVNALAAALDAEQLALVAKFSAEAAE